MPPGGAEALDGTNFPDMTAQGLNPSGEYVPLFHQRHQGDNTAPHERPWYSFHVLTAESP
jgi:hypothetical protein